MTNSSGRRIALFGGAFDPPHLGHAVVIQSILDSGWVDELWLMPSGAQRYDKSTQATAAQRLIMCQLFLAECFPNNQRVKIETADLDGRIVDSATLKALEFMLEQHPTKRFFVVIGSDNIKNLPSWKFADRLLKEANFIAVTRAGQPFHGEPPSNVRLLEPKQASSISSTEVRKSLSRRSNLSGLLPNKVGRYILENELYDLG